MIEAREPSKAPVVLITGATGNLGRSIAEALADAYQVVGLDREGDEDADFPVVAADLTDGDAIAAALDEVRNRWGSRLASVIHLAAFFDFSGEDHPLYEKLNVEGTRMLLEALRDRFDVEQFVYASTMLVHQAGEPGERIDEGQPIEPRWAYPKSKVKAEAAIRNAGRGIHHVILRLAGVYDEKTMVPTLAHQIARIYERGVKSYFYSGSTEAGQSMVHREDMVDAFRRTVDRRADLPPETTILIGESEAPGYDDLQDEIGRLIHGREDWPTVRLPSTVAAAATWAEDKLEPVIPDALDKGEGPFIQPFMARMASDHYALDIRRAQALLGWTPRHRLKEVLPAIIANLKRDPLAWYRANNVAPPDWIEQAEAAGFEAEDVRERHERKLKEEHAAFRWAHFLNIGLGFWLLTQPPLINVQQDWLAWIEVFLGGAIVVFATLSLSWRMQWARWVTAGLGLLAMFAPLVFWTDNAADYLSDTLVGMLVFGFALGSRPETGPSPIAALSGPDIPPGWSYNPSTWSQRMPIIALALLGLIISRWLAAYQMDQIPGVWEPFFHGSPADPQNGTEEIITSSVSEAFPVPDAALGAYVYAIEIVTGIIGSRLRWRTMPWLVVLFGIMIAPLGIISISFIIIQPIVIGTWSTLTLIAAAAMLIQIPYSLDELLASLQFVRRRAAAGRNWLTVFLKGDTDEGQRSDDQPDEFDAPAGEVVREMVSGGVNLPWNLLLCLPIGVALMCTRLLFDSQDWMANSDHLIGSLVLTVVSVAAAEVARPIRFLLIPLGLALFISPFAFGAETWATVFSLVSGAALIALSIRRGSICQHYGTWNRLLK